MTEIICKCGHRIEEHYDYILYDSYPEAIAQEQGCQPQKANCSCGLSPDIVEARYWARRMMKERTALQAKLDEAIEMYEEAVSIIDNGNMDDNDIQIIHDNLVKIRGDK